MRNIVKFGFLLAALSVSISSFGQTTKGSFIVSGSTGLQFGSSNAKLTYDGQTQSENDITTFSFTPSVGYFIVDNLAIGLSCNIVSNKSEMKDVGSSSSTSLMLAPTAMYYFPIDGKLRPYAQLGVGYMTMKEEMNISLIGGDSDEQTLNGLAVNFGGGVSYFVSKSFSIDLSLSYSKSTLTDADDDKGKIKQGTFGSNIGISVFF